MPTFRIRGPENRNSLRTLAKLVHFAVNRERQLRIGKRKAPNRETSGVVIYSHRKFRTVFEKSELLRVNFAKKIRYLRGYDL